MLTHGRASPYKTSIVYDSQNLSGLITACDVRGFK